MAGLADMSQRLGVTSIESVLVTHPHAYHVRHLIEVIKLVLVEKFAAFTYLHSDAQNPICGTAHNVASPEMLYVSGSSGAQFDQRAQALRGTDDIVAAISAGTESVH